MNNENELLEIGGGFLDSGKYNKAIDIFSDVIKQNENSSIAYHYRGMANFRLLNIEDSLLDINKAIALNPQSHEAWFSKGEILRHKKSWAEAKHCYITADSLYPDSLFYLTGLLSATAALSEHGLTIHYANRILDDTPADKIALSYRGIAYGRSKVYTEAIKDYLKLSKIDKPNAYIHNNLGYWYIKINDLKKAYNNLSVAIQLNPYHPYALNNMSYVEYLNGNYKKALDLCNSSIDIDSSNGLAYRNRALIYLKRGSKELARKDGWMAEKLSIGEEYYDEIIDLINSIN